jgi:hypothetical protein
LLEKNLGRECKCMAGCAIQIGNPRSGNTWELGACVDVDMVDRVKQEYFSSPCSSRNKINILCNVPLEIESLVILRRRDYPLWSEVRALRRGTLTLSITEMQGRHCHLDDVFESDRGRQPPERLLTMFRM